MQTTTKVDVFWGGGSWPSHHTFQLWTKGSWTNQHYWMDDMALAFDGILSIPEINIYVKGRWFARADSLVGLSVVGIIFVKLFVRPHLGSGSKIHQSQKIHMSLVWAAGSVAEEYTLKACPFGDDPLFWEKLCGQEEEHMVNISEWLELDLYEHSKLAVKKATQGDNTTLKSLCHTFILGKLFHPWCFSFSWRVSGDTH